MGDHQLMHAAPAMYNGGDGGKQAKSCTTTASSESPGNNSSLTFQETASINDPAVAGFTDWNNPYILIEPTGKPAPAAGLLQQYQYQQMGGQTGAREPLQFTNDAAFWNQSAGFGMGMAAPPATDNTSVRAAKQPSPAPRGANLALKTVLEGVGDSSSIVAKKASGEPAFKKPRMETPSPLPTFKVLSAPYLKSGHHQHQVPQYLKSSSNGSPDKSCKDGGEVSLKGRGLCLVPISSTFAVASDVPVDFWNPFGPQFR
ncbi:unnamed protein product [Triticum turgidum subsp. durum]|uniref:Uncharacterized protein n=1 Tax=Triticum turgidum subsp. durum TaxID=4567 RepID=A0A9R1RUG3_TRITD|nr:unnamed protein product [Triticum turgidum subsp. durum]